MITICLIAFVCYARGSDSISVFAPAKQFTPWRFYSVTGFKTAVYGGSILAFNNLWYKDFPKTNFHWFNDNNQWMGLDKMGHLAGAYRVAQVSTNMFLWSGVKQHKAVLAGSLIGLVSSSTVEIFDAYSAQWGASWGDLLANLAGASILFAEYQLNDPFFFNIKLSAHKTPLAALRPEVLGHNRLESIFKDYNGQTYWFSMGLHKLVPNQKIPKWLNIAFGYGAENMLGGKNNPLYNSNGIELPQLTRYRQYYLSLDIEVRKIKTKSDFINAILKNIAFIKIPAPTIEFNRFGNKAYWFYI